MGLCMPHSGASALIALLYCNFAHRLHYARVTRCVLASMMGNHQRIRSASYAKIVVWYRGCSIHQLVPISMFVCAGALIRMLAALFIIFGPALD
jgi:hypothetical protein